MQILLGSYLFHFRINSHLREVLDKYTPSNKFIFKSEYLSKRSNFLFINNNKCGAK